MGLPMVGRSVRFRHTSANILICSGRWLVNRRFLLPIIHFPATPLTMSPRKPKPFKGTTEVKRQARLRVGSPPAAQTHVNRRKKLPKHKKREKYSDTEDLAIG